LKRMVGLIPWERTKPYSKLRHRLVCSWRGHRLSPVAMAEEAHKVAYLQRQVGDLYECERCHGRTYRILPPNASVSIPGGEPGYAPRDCSDSRCAVCKQRNSSVRHHVNDDGSVTVWHCNVVGCSNHIDYPNAEGESRAASARTLHPLVGDSES
jgi:hypothetical protein